MKSVTTALLARAAAATLYLTFVSIEKHFGYKNILFFPQNAATQL